MIAWNILKGPVQFSVSRRFPSLWRVELGPEIATKRSSSIGVSRGFSMQQRPFTIATVLWYHPSTCYSVWIYMRLHCIRIHLLFADPHSYQLPFTSCCLATKPTKTSVSYSVLIKLQMTHRCKTYLEHQHTNSHLKPCVSLWEDVGNISRPWNWLSSHNGHDVRTTNGASDHNRPNNYYQTEVISASPFRSIQ